MATAGGKVSMDVTISVDEDVGVVGLRWRDAVSEPFVGELDVVSDDPQIDLARFLGATVGVTLRGSARRTQYLWGEVDRVEHARGSRGGAVYRLRLRPELGRLAERRRSRVFADMSALDVVREVVAEHGVAPALIRVVRSVETRPVVIQHDETDLDFVRRLLGEESLWWSFQHDASGHRMVIADAPSDRRRKLPMIRTAAEGDGVVDWTASVEIVEDGPRRSATGRALTIGLDAGEVVHLAGHERRDQNTAHTIVEVDIGVDAHDDVRPAMRDVPATVVTSLVTVPAGTAPIEVGAPRPDTGRAYTATVVGALGEQAYVGEGGRVEIAIHWPDGDEETSIWAPVAQPWAGAGHGTTYWPRVGDRVWVEFEGGDTSRPVVTGSLYTDEAPPPEPLPESGRRTILHAGAGSVVLDDAGGEQSLRIVSTGSMSVAVADEMLADVASDGTLTFDRDLTLEAGRDLVLRCGDASITLSGDGGVEIDGEVITIRGEASIALDSPSVSGT